MQTSKAIVAVNKDAEAPIFALADLGVVGDLHKVLDSVIAEVKKRRRWWGVRLAAPLVPRLSFFT